MSFHSISDEKLYIDKKEDLVEKLLKLNIISYREIAELCNLSFNKVAEISKILKVE